MDSLVTPENQRPIDIAIDGADELDKSFYGSKAAVGLMPMKGPSLIMQKK